MISMTRRRMVRVVEPVKGLVEERWWVMRKWRVRKRVRMEVMTGCGRFLDFVFGEGVFSLVCGWGAGGWGAL